MQTYLWEFEVLPNLPKLEGVVGNPLHPRLNPLTPQLCDVDLYLDTNINVASSASVSLQREKEKTKERRNSWDRGKGCAHWLGPCSSTIVTTHWSRVHICHWIATSSTFCLHLMLWIDKSEHDAIQICFSTHSKMVKIMIKESSAKW